MAHIFLESSNMLKLMKSYYQELMTIFIQTVFITIFILYIINLVFIFKKDINNLKIWKSIILVLNGAALIFGGLLVYYFTILFWMINNDVFSVLRDNSGVNLFFIGFVLYFLVINIVLSVFVIRKKPSNVNTPKA